MAVFSCVRFVKASPGALLLLVALMACGLASPARAGFTKKEIEESESDRRESTEHRIHSLASELAATAKRHGNDSVSLQAGLLLHALAAGAVGACEVTVVGESRQAGSAFLEVDVVTGLIFDSEASTQQTQFGHLWRTIAAPTLKGMKSFETKPRGLELVFLYGTQRFSELAENKADPRAPAETRAFRIAIPEQALADLLVGAIDIEALLDRATVLDGTRAIPSSDLREK